MTASLPQTLAFKAATGNALTIFRAGQPTDLSSIRVYNDSITASNACFQGSHWKCFDNLSRWFCLDLHYLAENFSLARLSCWLGADFQSCQSCNSEDSSLFHICCCNLCQFIEKACAFCLLQIPSCSQCLGNCTFRHSLHIC